VSEWAARKVLDKSIWLGPLRGLITHIADKEEEQLYARFSTEVLDDGEQRRVVSVLVPVMSAELAARVFGRACEIRAELSFPPGHDQAKWNLFGQLKDLLRAISPAMLLEGTSNKLDQEPDKIELEVLTDILPATSLTKPDVRSSVSEDMRLKLRAYLKRAAKLGADPEGLRAYTRAELAQLLANVGEREDLDDIRRLIEADSVRLQKAQAARIAGDRTQDTVGYGVSYLSAVTTVDPAAAVDVIVTLLIPDPQYVYVLPHQLPGLARRSTGRRGFGSDRMDFKKIWKARSGQTDEIFVEDRRIRFADALIEQINRVQTERDAATDKRGFDNRLRLYGGVLAALDGKRSAKLVLDLMALPGRWEGWTRVGAIESLLSWGVRLSLDEILRVLDPVKQDIQDSGHNDQSVWLFARWVSVMTFVDPPAAGVAKIRELISEHRIRPYDLGNVVAALGASRCDEAVDVLLEFAGADGKSVEVLGEQWIQAIGTLEGPRSTDILLSFVDPNGTVFNREFIPDQRHGDLFARLLAERAVKDKALKSKLFDLANGELTKTKRMLLAKVFGQFSDEGDRVQGLSILRDDDFGVAYELVRSMEDAFLERRPYGASGSAYTLSPLGCNAIRRRLFEMVIGDPHREKSAFTLLGQIEIWRLEHGHPADEPRHPAIESEVSWPPLLS
jgi:NACHT conflict system protein